MLVEQQHLELALSQAKRAESLSEIRYRAGATPLQLWLDEQQRLRVAEIGVAQNRLDQFVNHARLYRVLGGDTSTEQIECAREAGVF